MCFNLSSTRFWALVHLVLSTRREPLVTKHSARNPPPLEKSLELSRDFMDR